MVSDNALNRSLCSSIGIRWADRAMFRDWDHIGEPSCVAIHGSRGGEDYVGHVVFGHGTKKADCTVDIGTVIFERNFSGLSNSLKMINKYQRLLVKGMIAKVES